MILLTTLVLGLAFDLGSKAWSFATVASKPVMLDREMLVANPTFDPVPAHLPQATMPGVLNLRLVINRGAVFGIAANQRAFFIAFTVVAIGLGMVVFGRMIGADAFHAQVALGLVLAGGIGNLYDRITYGAVRDFLHMFPGNQLPSGWTWPGGNPEMFPWVFNIADVMLLVGMIVLMRYLNRRRQAIRAESASETEATALTGGQTA
jgi:signal peptidase II